MDLSKNLRSILEGCEAVKPGEKILIVADNEIPTARLGQKLLDVILSMGNDATLAIIPSREIDGAEPSAAVAAAMKAVNAIFSVAAKATISHTTARKESTALGVRFHLITGTEKDLEKEISVEDFRLVKERTIKLSKALRKAKVARVTTKSGTDITFEIGGRPTLAVYPGNPFNGPIPYYAESAVTPIEGTAEGTIVVDLAFRNWNYLLEEPVKIAVKGGKLVDISGAKKDVDRLWQLAKTDENATNIAELGIGTSYILPRPLSGSSLDFARYGTAHIALGRNNDIGGNTMSLIHQDVLMNEPTIELDNQCVLRDGVVVI